MTDRDCDFLVWPWTQHEAIDFLIQRIAAGQVAVVVKPLSFLLDRIRIVSLDAGRLRFVPVGWSRHEKG
ncbi:MAG: hypothetical protein DMG57_31730 [Acidobacteria bacterium]|nr:MAG: hypothetical protein DMG57_31730 [Acidobacteriota bacterium]